VSASTANDRPPRRGRQGRPCSERPQRPAGRCPRMFHATLWDGRPWPSCNDHEHQKQQGTRPTISRRRGRRTSATACGSASTVARRAICRSSSNRF